MIWELSAAAAHHSYHGHVAELGFLRLIHIVKVGRLLRFMRSVAGLGGLAGPGPDPNVEAQMLIARIVTIVTLLLILTTGVVQFVSSFEELGGFVSTTGVTDGNGPGGAGVLLDLLEVR